MFQSPTVPENANYFLRRNHQELEKTTSNHCPMKPLCTPPSLRAVRTPLTDHIVPELTCYRVTRPCRLQQLKWVVSRAEERNMTLSSTSTLVVVCTLRENLSLAMREGCENTSEVRGNAHATTSCSLTHMTQLGRALQENAFRKLVVTPSSPHVCVGRVLFMKERHNHAEGP